MKFLLIIFALGGSFSVPYEDMEACKYGKMQVLLDEPSGWATAFCLDLNRPSRGEVTIRLKSDGAEIVVAPHQAEYMVSRGVAERVR